MKTERYSDKAKENKTFGVKAKNEIGRAFVTMAYLTIIAAFVTPFVTHNWVMTIGDTVLAFIFIIIFFVLGVTTLNSAEEMERSNPKLSNSRTLELKNLQT